MSGETARGYTHEEVNLLFRDVGNLAKRTYVL
jgi:hypothetical protein